MSQNKSPFSVPKELPVRIQNLGKFIDKGLSWYKQIQNALSKIKRAVHPAQSIFQQSESVRPEQTSYVQRRSHKPSD